MASLGNRVRVNTSTAGTGTVTLGSAFSSAFCTFAEAGITDGQTVPYVIEEGNDFEIGTGVYTSAGTTLTRATVTLSKIAGVSGTTKMTLAGAATVRIDARKEDIQTTQRQTKTANYTVVATDYGTWIEATSGTWTLTLTAAATLGAKFWFIFRNGGTGEVTYDGNASETIDGLTTFKAYPGEARMLVCDGSNWNSVLLEPGTVTFDASGTWTKPGTGTVVLVEAWGGGGSGGKGASNSPCGGGGGGSYSALWIPFSSAGTTETVTIGAGGTGQTVASTAGNVGGSTTFGSWVTTFGGGGGGTNALGGGGGGGGGVWAAGATAVGQASGTPGTGPAGGSGGYGGESVGPTVANGAGNPGLYGGGGGGYGVDTAGTTNADGGRAYYGGGGGGGAADSGTPGVGGASTYGGAGSAGAIDANNSSNGTTPGGGSGGTEGGNSGNGGGGRIKVTVF